MAQRRTAIDSRDCTNGQGPDRDQGVCDWSIIDRREAAEVLVNVVAMTFGEQINYDYVTRRAKKLTLHNISYTKRNIGYMSIEKSATMNDKRYIPRAI